MELWLLKVRSGKPIERAEMFQMLNAKSLLFVPGDRSDRFDKAASSGADLVVCDLEDSVLPESKERARELVRIWLSSGNSACVRINSIDSQWYEQDLQALSGLKGLIAVMVPKAESPEKINMLSIALEGQTPILALIESALGVHRALEIAHVPGVARIAFGSIDYALDIQSDESDEALLNARSTLVLASRVAGIAAPIDGITKQFVDSSQAALDANKARGLGFSGKLCIHPSQIFGVNAAFSPTAEQIQGANLIISSLDNSGVGRLDGEMIDKPVIERARNILRQDQLYSHSNNHVEEN